MTYTMYTLQMICDQLNLNYDEERASLMEQGLKTPDTRVTVFHLTNSDAVLNINDETETIGVYLRDPHTGRYHCAGTLMQL